MPISLQRSQTLLFIGDSITDCGRSECKEQIGSGYPRLIRDYLLAKTPTTAPKVINTGISGNKVTDLQKRWDADVLAHRPDVLSIKIGINDVWHGLAGRSAGVDIETFTKIYRELLEKTRAALPKIQLVLCEPSVIWAPAPPEGNEILKPYVAAVSALAKPVGAIAVPLHDTFNRAREQRPDVTWAGDGVHPSSIGHMLIARTWLTSTGLL